VALLIVVIALLIYFQLAHHRQKELLAARVALDTETKERRILASDLHDSIGSMLSVLRLKMENDAPQEETLQLLNHTATELRRVAHHLMPEELLRGGLRQALADFALSVPGAQFHFFSTDDVQLNQEVELVLYRCAYELVNNALRHADAQHINIQLMVDNHEVTLTVSDDGKGIENEERKEMNEEGSGLQNIRNRISRFGGKLDIISTVGTEINVTIPL
jgi:signal transduction histidine kinase